MIVAIFFYTMSLSILDLNVAYSFTVMNHIAILYGSYYFLDEEISGARNLGVLTLCIGIIIFNSV